MDLNRINFVKKCKQLLEAYKQGDLGYSVMPEDSNPGFSDDLKEDRLVYFTFPMSLNYQRDSYKLWQAALKTYQDKDTKDVFYIKNLVGMSDDELRNKLSKYKLALLPNKHVSTWKTLAKTISDNWNSMQNLFESIDNDHLKLKEVVQNKFKKNFPYLSGPKIFNYWSYIVSTYGKIPIKNRSYIEIAPDTHITRSSVVLGLITEEEAVKLPKDRISCLWRDILKDSGVDPIDMHPPLWFWSRNNFKFKLDRKKNTP